MNNKQIKDVLMHELSLEEAHVTIQGTHVQVIVVGKQFAGISRVKKQQIVYTPLMKYILDNSIHAVSIKAFTTEEWQRYRKVITHNPHD
ncbi:BolA family protein [Candidatus Profftia tarda]|nr:BolA family protein [Candidatus Profftia tarda]